MLHGSKLQASSEGFVQSSWDGKYVVVEFADF